MIYALRIKRILTLDDSKALGADEKKNPLKEGAGNHNLPYHVEIGIQQPPGIKSIPGTTTGVLLQLACLLILEGRLTYRQGRAPFLCLSAGARASPRSPCRNNSSDYSLSIPIGVRRGDKLQYQYMQSIKKLVSIGTAKEQIGKRGTPSKRASVYSNQPSIYFMRHGAKGNRKKNPQRWKKSS